MGVFSLCVCRTCYLPISPSTAEVSIVAIMLSVIVPAIAGLTAGIGTISLCVCLKRRKKTTAPVGRTQDQGKWLLLFTILQ